MRDLDTMSTGKAEKALKGVADLFLGQVATKVLTLLFLIAFVRLLSRDELAVIPLYFAIGGASILLFSFGIPATLVREIPRLREENQEKMHSMLFTGFVVVTTGIIISAYLFSLFEKNIQALFFSSLAGQVEFSLFAAAMVVGGWKTFLAFVLKSLQMFRGLAIFTAGSDFLSKALGLTGFFVSGINGLLTGFLLGGLIVNGYTTWKVSNFLFATRKWYPLRELLRISWPFYFEGYLYYFRVQGDIFVISALLGTSALSVFYVAKRLYELLLSVYSSIEHVIAPSLSQLLGESIGSMARGYKRMADLIPLVVIPMGLLVAGLSYWFIDIIGGTEYAGEAYLLAALFCFVAVLRSLVLIRLKAVFVICRPLDRLKITLSQFAVYFIILFTMVMQFGIVSAPAAQAVSFMVASMYSGHLLSSQIVDRRISRMVWIVLVSSVVGLAMLVGLQMWYYTVFIVPVYLVAAMLAVILLSSILASDWDIIQLEKVLPSQLNKPFVFYMNIRKKIIG